MNSTSIPMHFTSGSTVPHGYTKSAPANHEQTFHQGYMEGNNVILFWHTQYETQFCGDMFFSNAHAPNAF